MLGLPLYVDITACCSFYTDTIVSTICTSNLCFCMCLYSEGFSVISDEQEFSSCRQPARCFCRCHAFQWANAKHIYV